MSYEMIIVDSTDCRNFVCKVTSSVTRGTHCFSDQPAQPAAINTTPNLGSRISEPSLPTGRRKRPKFYHGIAISGTRRMRVTQRCRLFIAIYFFDAVIFPYTMYTMREISSIFSQPREIIINSGSIRNMDYQVHVRIAK